MSIAAQIAGGNVNKGSRYIEPGNYLLEIEKVKSSFNRSGHAQFIVEFKTIESDNDNRAPGSSQSWVNNLTKHGEPALNSVKTFTSRLLGMDPEAPADEYEAAIDEIISDANPCEGMLIRCEAYNKKTKAGKDFTVCMWSPVTAEA